MILLLLIIYIAFISLGLPDSLLGAAWPTMQVQFGAPFAYAGLVSIIVTGGTIVSALLSDRITRRFGAGMVTAVSVLATAAAMLGYSLSTSFWMICLWAIPYGLGAGAIDAAINNYVALHYNARHMNWLHSFWGVGAAISPFIMSFALSRGLAWTDGFRTVFYIQICIALLMFVSLPLWNKHAGIAEEQRKTARVLSLREIVRIPGVPSVMLSFFAYCALESTAGLWASSYLVHARGIDRETAARFAALFYLGITAGRFLSGFISTRLGDKRMIHIGIAVMAVGVVAIFIPTAFTPLCLCGLVVLGLGSAPVFPAVIHATPENFGADKSQAIIGVQMASAYVGASLIPPLFGTVADGIGIGVYPFFLAAFVLMLFVMTQRLNRVVQKAKEANI